MAKRVAILQSNYIPWKGYFDLIRSVDEFILLDRVQYTRQDWRNRNRVKTQNGGQWLTIPIKGRGALVRTVWETRVAEPKWAARHWSAICQHYQHAPYFSLYRDFFEDIYLGQHELWLRTINRRFLTLLCSLLKIDTKISEAAESAQFANPTERLISLCQGVGAAEYLSGPLAQKYIQPELFAQAGIKLKFVDYHSYPEYPQMFPPFDHHVSVIDLLFNTGPEAIHFMKIL